MTTKRSREEDLEWITAMVELEEELGPLVPNGAQGGPAARKKREASADAPKQSAGARSRARVRGRFAAAKGRKPQAA